MSTPARYAPLAAVLVRAPALPVEAYLALPAESPAADEPVAPADPLVRAALAIASPDLLDRLDRVRAGTSGAARAVGALLRYRIRMSTRPTPFGLFAGVGLAELGERTELRLAEGPLRTRMRPDMGWLLAFVAQLEERSEVRRELCVMTNPTAWQHGGRVLLAQRAAVDGGGATGSVDIRATGVVRRALSLARRPIAWRKLAGEVATASATSEEKVDALLTDLWRETFLITELRPPLTHPSPARYVERRLEGIGAAQAEHATLAALLAAMEAWDASDLGERPAVQRALSARAARAVPSTRRRARAGRRCAAARRRPDWTAGRRCRRRRRRAAAAPRPSVRHRRPGRLSRGVLELVTAPTARSRCSSCSIPSAALDHQRLTAAPRIPGKLSPRLGAARACARSPSMP